MSNLIVTHVDLLLTVLWSSAVSLGEKNVKMLSAAVVSNTLKVNTLLVLSRLNLCTHLSHIQQI